MKQYQFNTQKPSFIDLLGSNSGVKVATYVIILSFLVFFGLLIATWIMRYRSHRIYYGPKCVYTTLINSSGSSQTNSIVLDQLSDFNSSLKDPENLTFNYVDQSNDIQPFYVTIYGSDTLPSGATLYPGGGITDSGFCAQPGGVSIYIKYYFNTTSWPGAIDVVEEGMARYLSSYVNIGGTDDGACAKIVLTQGSESVGYSTYHYSNQGPVPIKTDASGPSPSFFSNFVDGLNTIYISPVQTDPSNYDPFDDFLKTKQFINSKDTGCASNPENCRCTDPGAKQLPSCTSPYINGKGYVFKNSIGKTSYSSNCTHSGPQSSLHPGSGPENGNTTGGETYSSFYPTSSILAKTAQNAGTEQQKTLNDNSQLGGTDFSTISSSYSKAFQSNYVFCGACPTAGGTVPTPFGSFNNTTTPQNTTSIGVDTRASKVPNATVSGDNYNLGFS